MRSANWNSCTSSVRTNFRTDLICQTERQWAKQGYLKNDADCGMELWNNQYCRAKSLYLFADEVHKATDEEIRAYFAPERERRNAKQRKARAEQRKARAEAERQHIFSEKRMKAVDTAVLQRNPAGKRTIVIDTETTGLDCNTDEILQLSIIDDSGNTLFNEYFKPVKTMEWKAAERVNGITPQMVADCEDIYHHFGEIQQILYDADTIIGYNTEFDLAFLRNCGFELSEDTTKVDVMRDFAPIYGEWNEDWQDYKWQKLTTCAAYYEYDWGNSEKAHNSLGDCLATLFCYTKMKSERN